ncbi:MAG TPA: fused MFS/spermidine synthase [Coriobacteriia bacterium]|nr:fused MFS/spermidine synthase [Coriobacteriia bacterium]
MEREINTPFHLLRITDNDGVRLLRFERNRQSSMYIDDPFETDFEYPGYLHLPLAIRPDAVRTLILGLGGGSVVKRMWRDYPEMRIDTVEIDKGVVDVAREYFALPDDERLEVYVDDGRNFLATSNEIYDVVIVDAFDDDRMPRDLTTEEFLRSVRDHLEDDGVIAYNCIGAVYGPRSKPFRSLYRTAANIWRRLWVFPIGISDDATDKTRNIILLATDANLSTDELLERIGSRVDGLVTVPKFERFGEDLYRQRIRAGDVPLLVDERRSRKGRRH